MTVPAVTGIVLAGGRSSRFGTDKLAALVGGEPLLHLPIRALAEVAGEIVVVVGPDAPAPPVPADLGVRVVVARDPVAGLGPLAGLAAGLAAASAPVALLVGGDQPALRPALLRGLRDRLEAGTGDPAIDAAALVDDGRIRPLPVSLRVAAARAAADAALADGTRSLLGLLDRLRVDGIGPAAWRLLDPDGASLRDVDEPGDLTAR